MTASDHVVIGLEDGEQSAVSERAMNWIDRYNSRKLPCCIPERACLQKRRTICLHFAM